MSGKPYRAAGAAAQASLAEVQQLLLHATPESIKHCLPLIQSAIQCLNQLQALTPAPGENSFERQELRLEFRRLACDVAKVNALLHHAGRLHLGWASFLASAGPEYSTQGTLFPAPSMSRVSFDG